MKQLILIAFNPDELLFTRVYDEEEFEEAHNKFDELFTNKDDQTDVSLMTRETYFTKHIQPAGYVEWLDLANEFLENNSTNLIEIGEYFEEYKSGMKWEVVAVKHISKFN
tara:strand:- start:53 stop:382 length:330 start_codon:yes stop_codon:yes gene_type:complete